MRSTTITSRIDSAPSTRPDRTGVSASWRRWIFLLGVLCLLGAADRGHAADDRTSASRGTPGVPLPNFDEFTGRAPFRLNVLPTTSYGPAWADIVERPGNFLACRGASIALCYYSGPGPVTPCTFEPGKPMANCSCYEIPAGAPYFVDINAILNLDVYLETVLACGRDGSNCLPRGSRTAPACDAVNTNRMIPGADLVSTFSLYLEKEIPIEQTNCATAAVYAGCMTAPCKRTGVTDPTTGLPIVQCSCPTFNGPYQVGQDLAETGQSCVLGGRHVWSAAYATYEGGTIPTPPDNGCFPDVGGEMGCPLLSPKPPVIPSVPASISCREVCAEYRSSLHRGIEVAYTCDATLCTAQADDFDLVREACSGLGDSSVSETLKLETLVGRSCAASQMCRCEPRQATKAKIFELNAKQRARNIAPQCDLNGTLCGAP